MSTIATNKKAYHNYKLLDKWECGIALNGGEVKSLRAGGASFTDAFAHIDKGELFLYNLHINPYEQASFLNEEPARPRKLLVHAKELERINGNLTRKGLTLIPTKIYFNKKGWAKVEIAVGQGKKLYDKREDIKKREIKREIDRSVKRILALLLTVSLGASTVHAQGLFSGQTRQERIKQWFQQKVIQADAQADNDAHFTLM